MLLLAIIIACNIYCAILQYLLQDIAKFFHHENYHKKSTPTRLLITNRVLETLLYRLWVKGMSSRAFLVILISADFLLFQKYSTIHLFVIRKLIWGLLSLVRCRSTIITPCYEFFRKILKSGFERLFRLYSKRDEPIDWFWWSKIVIITFQTHFHMIKSIIFLN